MAKFNKNLAEQRSLQGISQKSMAEALGVAQSTYSLYEKGAREPNIEKIVAISQILKVSADELLGVETKKSELYEMFLSLDSIDRAEITGTIKQMLKSDKYKGEE